VTDDLRVALLGYGLAGRFFHAPLIRLVDGLRLKAVVTTNPERAAAVHSDDPKVAVVAEPDAIWARAEEFDLVVVATANRAHLPQARASIAAGLPVVVDKPLCRTSADALALRDEAAIRGVPVTVFQNRRWDGDFLAVRAAVDSGDLGTVHRFESRFERWRVEPKGYWRESGDPEDLGGLLYDLGSHLVDQAQVLLGPVRHIHAEVRRVRPWAEVNDDVFLALEHDSGAVSHLWASSVAGAPGPRFRVLASAGAWVSDGLDGQEAALRAGQSPYDVPPHSARLVLAAEGDHIEELAVPDASGDWPAFYRAVVPWARGDGPPPVALDDVVATLTVLETAARSVNA
jgi:scyllo-inositol 2-dehydrogenase (NADP+)